MSNVLSNFVKNNYGDKEVFHDIKKIPYIEEVNGSILFEIVTKEEFLTLLDIFFEKGFYILKIFSFFEGQILLELTGSNVSDVYIEDLYLNCSVSVPCTSKNIKDLFNNYDEHMIKAINILNGIETDKTNELAKEKEKKILVEELNNLEDDILTESKIVDVDNLQDIDIPDIYRSPQDEKVPVVLVADRIIMKEDFLDRLASYYRDDSLKSAVIVNLFALVDEVTNPKHPVPFLLKAIEELRKTSVTNDREVILKHYNKFRDVCKSWFSVLKNLNVTHFVCRRVYNSDRLTTPEIVLWLWGYFVIGKNAKWVMSSSDGSLRVYKNEFMDADLKANSFYKSEATKIINNPINIVVNSLEKYMVLGYLNYKYDNGTMIDNIPTWKSDNTSIESHIAGSFGKFLREPGRIDIVEQINKINGKNSGSDTRLKLYETFIERVFKLY